MSANTAVKRKSRATPRRASALVALRASALIKQYAKLGGIAFPSTPEEYASFLAAEQAKWSRIVSAIGFRE